MSKRFYCFNCGEENSHFSRNCTVLDQQFTRCPECNAVAKTPAGHRVTCSYSHFISTKIGDYELALLSSNRIRFTFENVDQIFCSEANKDGIENFLITKFFSVGNNIQLRRIYGTPKKIILEMKYKPSITISIGRLNSSKQMMSMMCCVDQLRINHYQHINHQGTVTYNLSARPKFDDIHDIVLQVKSEADPILFSLSWNNVNANVAITESNVTIH